MTDKKLDTKCTLDVNGKKYVYHSIPVAEKAGLGSYSRLPYSLKVLLENLLRNIDGKTVTQDDIVAFTHWLDTKKSNREIAYRPARVLMQDFTGVPAIVDLAAMRAAMEKLGSDPEKINPQIPVDLVIDHSVQVDSFASQKALEKNIEFEMERNAERYEFLRWGQTAFENFRVVPPGTGICHQVNLEYLANVAWTRKDGAETLVYPDTLVGTDSHTTMINGLGVLGWGVGGIEAEAAMLGQPISMVIPEVIGVRLDGKLPEGIIATDLVLTVTQILRQRGVVGKFVEFYGPGLDQLPLADRATIANMAPEYGATCGFFPVDVETLKYLEISGRDEQTIALVEAYSKAQGLWRDKDSADPIYTDNLDLDLGSIEACVAGPKRPQDRVAIANLTNVFDQVLEDNKKLAEKNKSFPVNETDFNLQHGSVVIAAITSCTNTSNPSVLIAAGLLAKNAIKKGLMTKPWVKTSLAPGSKVVTEYLENAGLQRYLDQLGFNLVGYGCTTCIGNSGPLLDPITDSITENDIVVSAVLSGNRNFEGRVHPLTKANWLASPPLVVAYALAGKTGIDLSKDPIAESASGEKIYLKDIWPSNLEIAEEVSKSVTRSMFQKEYEDVFAGDSHWQKIPVTESKTYQWNDNSTYVRHPSFFEELDSSTDVIDDIKDARILALLGDSVTTDHISPAGVIKKQSPAGQYLIDHGIPMREFNSYGSRRGNHEVMMRGTFANIRIRNEMLNDVEGGFTKYIPSGETLPIYDAAMNYQKDNTPLVIIAGKEYGTGSSRDWAAKGTFLLGVKAVITESFERIHRSNLLGMGVLPLEFIDTDRKQLGLNGEEMVSISGLSQLSPRCHLAACITRKDGQKLNFEVLCRIDTENELHYYKNQGILHYVLRNLSKQ